MEAYNIDQNELLSIYLKNKGQFSFQAGRFAEETFTQQMNAGEPSWTFFIQVMSTLGLSIDIILREKPVQESVVKLIEAPPPLRFNSTGRDTIFEDAQCHLIRSLWSFQRPDHTQFLIVSIERRNRSTHPNHTVDIVTALVDKNQLSMIRDQSTFLQKVTVIDFAQTGWTYHDHLMAKCASLITNQILMERYEGSEDYNAADVIAVPNLDYTQYLLQNVSQTYPVILLKVCITYKDNKEVSRVFSPLVSIPNPLDQDLSS